MAFGQLDQVMRRDVGGHADGDARGPVEQQVGQAGRQHGRLLQRAIEVVHEIDGVLVDIGEQLLGHLRQAGLGVAHRRRRIAIDRAEVALTVDQHVAHGEVLRHARHGVVHGGVAVRVVLAQHLADDSGGLAVGRGRPHAHVVHGVQDPPMNGLEPVTGVGQSARHDDAHGVVQVRPAHLLVYVNLTDGSDVHGPEISQADSRRGFAQRGTGELYRGPS